MAYITIAEYAKRAGVSKQTAYNRAKAPQYRGYFRKVRGVLQVDENIFNEIFKFNSTEETEELKGETDFSFKSNSSDNSNDSQTVVNELVSLLKQQIETQERQIENLSSMIAEKDNAIKGLTENIVELSAQIGRITANIQQLQHERNMIEAGQVITGQKPKEETETTEERSKKGLFSRFRRKQ